MINRKSNAHDKLKKKKKKHIYTCDYEGIAVEAKP